MITRDAFLAVLARHLAVACGPEDIAPDASLRLLGLNSMRAVSLALDLEDAFGFTFPDDAFTDDNFATADTIWAVVSACSNRGGG
jgi:acyl carrier protein